MPNQNALRLHDFEFSPLSPWGKERDINSVDQNRSEGKSSEVSADVKQLGCTNNKKNEKMPIKDLNRDISRQKMFSSRNFSISEPSHFDLYPEISSPKGKVTNLYSQFSNVLNIFCKNLIHATKNRNAE